jgi:hypothetical protein
MSAGTVDGKKNQHECEANKDHFHPVTERIGVFEQKHHDKHNEGGFRPAGKKHAEAKPSVP